MSAGEWEWRVVVIESGAGPVSGAVTDGAVQWEASCDVVRIGSRFELRCVAGIAVCRGTNKNVVGVALCAGNRSVGTSEWEQCFGVVEDGAGPVGGAMTNGAVEREVSLHVIRICGALVIG